MASSPRGSDSVTLPPADAFDALGDEVRIRIVRLLGDADDPLTFTELRDRLGLHRGSEFNYHLDKLTGHFVSKSDDGYALSPRGSQVYQAVLSGALTEDPTVEPTPIDESCYHCGERIMIDYRDQVAFIYCPGCEGNFAFSDEELQDRLGSAELSQQLGVKSMHPFPPALVKGRDAEEIHRAAVTWFHREMLSWAVDVCPRCASVLESSVDVCGEHTRSAGLCDVCGNLQATMLRTDCTNCNYSKEGLFSYRLFAETAMLDFITDNGLNPVDPDSPETFWGYFTPYEEEILSVEPFEARFTFGIEDDALTLTVDDELSVVEARRHDHSGSAG